MRLTPGDPANPHYVAMWMAGNRARRDIKTLRTQLDKAQRRHSKGTTVPLDQLERLLTRLETTDAER